MPEKEFEDYLVEHSLSIQASHYLSPIFPLFLLCLSLKTNLVMSLFCEKLFLQFHEKCWVFVRSNISKGRSTKGSPKDPMLRSRFQTDLKIALSNAENLRLPQTAFLFLLTLHHFQNLSWKSYKVLFRSARTSCNTSGRSVPARQIWITYIHAYRSISPGRG